MHRRTTSNINTYTYRNILNRVHELHFDLSFGVTVFVFYVFVKFQKKKKKKEINISLHHMVFKLLCVRLCWMKKREVKEIVYSIANTWHQNNHNNDNADDCDYDYNRIEQQQQQPWNIIFHSCQFKFSREFAIEIKCEVFVGICSFFITIFGIYYVCDYVWVCTCIDIS